MGTLISSNMKVPMSRIKVDYENYQRLDRNHINKIKRTYNEDLMTAAIASLRPDGFYYLIDGGTRFVAKFELLGLHEFLECKVFTGLTVEEEAEMFVEFNSASKSTTFNENMKARICEKEPEAVRYDNLLKESGIRYSYGNSGAGRKVMVCHRAGMTIMKRFGEGILKRTLVTADQAWPEDTQAFNNTVLLGISCFMRSFEGKYDYERLMKALRTTAPADIQNEGRRLGGTKATDTTSAGVPFAIYIVTRYNKGKRVGKLSLTDLK